jgi:cysteine desulfurase/selenocysteine lyase
MAETVCYLDHSSTAFPRHPGVAAAMSTAVARMASPHRGGYAPACEASQLVERCRQSAARRFGLRDPRRVIFTSGCTDSINQVLHGLLRPGDMVTACLADHNAVLRPLYRLAQGGVKVRLIPANKFAILDAALLRDAIHERPCKLLVLTHASNVTGAILALDDCLEVAHAAGVPVLLDAAQSAGHLPLAMDEFGIAAAAIPGHKALAGPPGIGLLCLGADFDFPPFRQGGTGVNSESEEMPASAPERHESGTPNVPGISGLLSALGHEQAELTRAMQLRREAWRALSTVDRVTLYGPGENDPAVPVLSFNIDGLPPEMIALWLAERGVAVRAGLHCAPGAHRALGTFDGGGTVRVSFGATNTGADVERLVQEVALLVEGCCVG